MNVVGFDDGPFPREHRGAVLLIGVVSSGTRIDGIVSGRIQRDGADSTSVMEKVVRASQFAASIQAVLLQGIAVGGFNVVDIHRLAERLEVPVLVVTRRRPNMAAVKRALFADLPTARPRVDGAAEKWALIEQAGTLEELGTSRRAERRAADAPSGLRAGASPKLWVQRAGLTLADARRVVQSTTLHGNIPEPLRVAHLIAGGVTTGTSRGRA